MKLELNLTKALILLIPVIIGWSLTKVQFVRIPPGGFGGSSIAASQSSSISEMPITFKKVSLVDKAASKTPVKTLTLSGTVTSAKLRLIATIKEPNSLGNDELIGIGIVVVSRKRGELLRGNYFESEWIGGQKKVLSQSRSPGLFLAGQRRTYEYDLNSIPVSNDYDKENAIYPAGKQYFNLLNELAMSELKINFYSSNSLFGIIESAEIIYEGSGNIEVK